MRPLLLFWAAYLASAQQFDPAQSIHFTSPAVDYSSVLVVGNGRVGGNVFGGINEEVWLNENTVMSGLYQKRVNPNAKKAWPQVRDLLTKNQFISAGNKGLADEVPDPALVRHYQPAGHLNIYTNGDASSMQNYVRQLDVSNGIVTVNYTLNGAQFTREVFASSPDQVLGVRWRSTKPFSATIYFEREQNIHTKSASINGNVYSFGLAGGSDSNPGQLDFQIAGRLVPVGGNVTIVNGNAFQYTGTGFDVFTDIQRVQRYPDSNARRTAVTNNVNSTATKGYDAVRKAAISDYQSLYNCVKLDLGSSGSVGQLTTDQRLSNHQSTPDNDPQLPALLYNYGRYLFIGSSRKGNMPLPPNLQGIWNLNYDPQFGSRYTTNINTQMLDWPSGPSNLADEMIVPFFGLLNATRFSGRHDALGDCAPNDNGTEYTLWPLSNAWLGTHLLESYRFTGDKNFLSTYSLPWMVEAATFYYSWLFTFEGYLTTAGSLSPEHAFIIPSGSEGAGQTTGMDIGTAMDDQLLYQVFSDIVTGYTALGQSSNNEVTKAKNAMAKIRPTQIGSYGQILKFRKEYDDPDPGHRHLSPLFGLFPGSTMTPQLNNTLAQASGVLLNHRLQNGGGSTGWSRAWVVNCFARLNQGDNAWSSAQVLIQRLLLANLLNSDSGSGSTFQMDGNTGLVSGINEMLLQSHVDVIHILPAQTSKAKAGSVKGLIGRGGFQVDIAWKAGGGLDRAMVTSQRGSRLTLRVNNGQAFLVDGQKNTGKITTTSGKTCTITSA